MRVCMKSHYYQNKPLHLCTLRLLVWHSALSVPAMEQGSVRHSGTGEREDWSTQGRGAGLAGKKKMPQPKT